MRTKNIIAGLTILEKYRTQQHGHNTGAEHDKIYAYATDRPVSEDDVKCLVELGWFQPDVEKDGDEFSEEFYDKDEGWVCYV